MFLYFYGVFAFLTACLFKLTRNPNEPHVAETYTRRMYGASWRLYEFMTISDDGASLSIGFEPKTHSTILQKSQQRIECDVYIGILVGQSIDNETCVSKWSS